MAGADEVLIVLRSIDHSLKELVAIARARRAGAGAAVASDRELDGPYGNPVVKFNPRDWVGDDCKGLHFSDCSADFLELLAESFEYFATKAEEKNERTTSDKPVADYKRKDAARARGWAERIRSGKHKPREMATTGATGDSNEWARDEF